MHYWAFLQMYFVSVWSDFIRKEDIIRWLLFSLKKKKSILLLNMTCICGTSEVPTHVSCFYCIEKCHLLIHWYSDIVSFCWKTHKPKTVIMWIKVMGANSQCLKNINSIQCLKKFMKVYSKSAKLVVCQISDDPSILHEVICYAFSREPWVCHIVYLHTETVS